MTIRRPRLAAATAALAGGALFVWSLRAFGTATVLEDVRRLGAGFIVIVALGGARHLVRAIAWRLCFDDPRPLSLAASVAAYVSGDAIGNVTPFGVLASEPSKIVIVRDRVAAGDAIPALALENLFYGSTVVAMLGLGTAALLRAFDVTATIRTAGLLVIAGAGVAIVAAVMIARWRPPLARPLGVFVAQHRGRLWTIAALEVTYHAAAVLEIWIALRLITGVTPTLLTAFVLEYANRTITIVFQFVPMWLGVDEAGTGAIATALGVGGPAGVALALARKARVAIWTAVGLLLLGTFRPRTPLNDTSRTQSERDHAVQLIRIKCS